MEMITVSAAFLALTVARKRSHTRCLFCCCSDMFTLPRNTKTAGKERKISRSHTETSYLFSCNYKNKKL
uniref:Uncharacterized protein n=1 Tax=Lepeophtheirus salmonis TaxID=72036 RepID=A0A0K2VHQ6_LEPSM